MEQRPEHAVGVADIIFVIILPREINGGKGQLPGGGDTGLGTSRFLNLAAPTEPDAAALLQSGPYRNCQSSRVGLCGDGRRYSIGNHHQSPVPGACPEEYRVCQSWISGCVGPTG